MDEVRSEYVREVQHTAAQILGQVQATALGLRQEFSQAAPPPALVMENQRLREDLVAITERLMELEKIENDRRETGKKICPPGNILLLSPRPGTAVWEVLV